MLINMTAVAYLLGSIVLYMSSRTKLYENDGALCTQLTTVANWLYAVFYEFIFAFLLKKAWIIYRTERIVRPSMWYKAAMLVAISGPTVGMPAFIALNVSQGYGLMVAGFCYDIFTTATTFYYYLAIILFYCAGYLWLFAAPVMWHARHVKALNAKHFNELRAIAKKNAILAAVSIVFQAATALIFLLVTVYYTLDIIYVSQIATLVSLLDVSISSLCCLLMTNLWMPARFRHVDSTTDSMHASVHASSPRVVSQVHNSVASTHAAETG